MPHSAYKKTNQSLTKASFIKRMMAYFIDFFTILTVLIGAAAIALLFVYLGKIIGLINPGESITHYLANNFIFASYLATTTVTFYSYYWVKIGQTIGMKICGLHIQNSDGSHITITQSLIRMATSAFGLGNLIAIFSPYHSFQDTWAECEVVAITQNNNT